MSVYLGSAGCIELRRSSLEEPFISEIRPSDVNDKTNRFSFDFPVGQFLTGDMIEIKALDKQPIDFISSSGWDHTGATPGGTPTGYHDGKFYIHVDQVGGIKLYTDFDKALSGEVLGRVDLLRPSRVIPISVAVSNNFERIIAQITDFEINTEREAVDVTELGDSFRQQYSGLISGSGRLTCFFEYERRLCDNLSGASPGSLEMPVYMNQLILRSKIGSEFFARLTLVGRGEKPGAYRADFDDEVWYELEGVITNVAMAFEPTQPIRCTINYITTGAVHLKTQTVTNYILQEQSSSDRIRLEAYQSGLLEQEQEE